MKSNKNTKVYSFTDLVVWKRGQELVLLIYKQTEGFPKSDRFGVSSQMQRSAVSIMSNIAEGFGRQTKNEKKHFYIIARASLVELKNQLLIARDTGKITNDDYSKADEVSTETHKFLHGLIKSTSGFTDRLFT